MGLLIFPNISEKLQNTGFSMPQYIPSQPFPVR